MNTPRAPISAPRRPRPPAALLAAAAAVLLLLLLPGAAPAQTAVRVATYNIKFLRSDITQERAANIAAVIAALDADVIGLQEIADRAALERVFDPARWDLIIDDGSRDDQDVALAVRRPLRARTASGNLDADNADFLFPRAAHNGPFPNRRDVLCIAVEVPALHNLGPAAASLGGWLLRDRAGNVYALAGAIEPGARLVIVLPAGKLPLNNDGDSVTLLDAAGEIVHTVSYTGPAAFNAPAGYLHSFGGQGRRFKMGRAGLGGCRRAFLPAPAGTPTEWPAE